MDKKITGWIVVDYKTGKLRTMKKLVNKNKLKASEIAVELSLNIEIPEHPQLKAEGKIVLSSTHVANMVLEQLTDASEEKDV